MAEGAGRMTAGTLEEPHDRLPDHEHAEAEQQRRQKLVDARLHSGKASRLSVTRPIRSMSPTSAPDNAAAVNRAAQICTVCP